MTAGPPYFLGAGKQFALNLVAKASRLTPRLRAYGGVLAPKVMNGKTPITAGGTSASALNKRLVRSGKTPVASRGPQKDRELHRLFDRHAILKWATQATGRPLSFPVDFPSSRSSRW